MFKISRKILNKVRLRNIISPVFIDGANSTDWFESAPFEPHAVSRFDQQVAGQSRERPQCRQSAAVVLASEPPPLVSAQHQEPLHVSVRQPGVGLR